MVSMQIGEKWLEELMFRLIFISAYFKYKRLQNTFDIFQAFTLLQVDCWNLDHLKLLLRVMTTDLKRQFAIDISYVYFIQNFLRNNVVIFIFSK